MQEPYRPASRLDNLWNGTFSVNIPSRRTLDVSFGYTGGGVALFAEGSEGRSQRFDATLGWRPTPAIRVEGLAAVSRLTRAHDGSEVSRTLIPRLKLELQPRRSLLFRIVTELRDERLDALRAAGTQSVLYVDGVASTPRKNRNLRTDWLVSYEPSPGTVAFLGYGSTLERPFDESATSLRRASDGFFLKLAYQFRN
jgi:hypothetical protein